MVHVGSTGTLEPEGSDAPARAAAIGLRKRSRPPNEQLDLRTSSNYRQHIPLTMLIQIAAVIVEIIIINFVNNVSDEVDKTMRARARSR